MHPGSAQGPLATERPPETAQDRPKLISASQFAQNSMFGQARLSPDGKAVAFVREVKGYASLAVASPDDGTIIREVFLPDGFSATGFEWAGNSRLLIDGRGTYTTSRYRYLLRRVFVASVDSGAVRSLVDNPLISNYAEILGVDPAGEYAMIAHPQKEGDDFPAVYRYDFAGDGARWLAQPKIDGVRSWSVDNRGTVRIGVGYDKANLRIWYRSAANAPIRETASFKQSDYAPFRAILQINAGDDRGYVLRAENGKPVGLHLFDFANAESVETIYENARWDVRSVYFHNDKPIAATYIDDAVQTKWLNPADEAMHANLRLALGSDDTRLTIHSRSRDNTRMLVWAGHEADPGVTYFFDRAKRDLRELAPHRPDLDFQALVKPKPVTYTARDGTTIHAYLALPKGREASALPLIIMPHGGPYGVRDRLIYDDQVQLLTNRGYAVLQPNYRGSGGYGEAFLDLGYGAVGRGMQDDLDDAMDWAVGEGIADPKRICLVGGSYGGYAAIWGVIRNPERYRCAASFAGVTDWEKQLRKDRRFLTRFDRRRFQDRLEGGEDFRLREVSPRGFGNSIKKPILLAHGTRDSIVPFEQFEDMMEASKDAPVPLTPFVMHGANHFFSRARDKKQWFDRLDAFLAEHNPADQLGASGEWVPPQDPNEAARFQPLLIGSD